MQLYTFVICILFLAIFPEIFAEWEPLFPQKTKHGKSCITPCEQRGYTYNWCYKFKGRTTKDSDWGRCSPRPGVTIYGETCHGECQLHKSSYYFCYTNSNGSWDYCGDTNSSTPSKTVVPQLKTFNGIDCTSPCEETPEYKAWCYTAGSGVWDYCSPKPTISSQQVYTYVGSKCVTPCQPLGRGGNYCYDANKNKLRLCSRVQGLTVNNEKCHTKCDLHGGNSSAPIEIYFWCWTNDARTTWDYCSNVDDNPSLGEGRTTFPKSRISLQLTKSNSLENIFSYQDEQEINRVTFFESLTRTGNDTFYNINNSTELQTQTLEYFKSWKGNAFKVLTTNDTPISTVGAVNFQHTRYEFLGQEYIQMQLQVNISKDKLQTIGEVQTPIALVKEHPEHVINAFLRSIYNGYAVHIERFDYEPS